MPPKFDSAHFGQGRRTSAHHRFSSRPKVSANWKARHPKSPSKERVIRSICRNLLDAKSERIGKIKMAMITKTAHRNHEELFPNHQSSLKVTDPELIEIFAFYEVLVQ